MDTITKNSIFTNVAYTSDGDIWWEGMSKEPPKDVEITDWLGKVWVCYLGNFLTHYFIQYLQAQPKNTAKSGSLAHANSRFTAPSTQCPVIDPKFEDPKGVPLSAIIFGGRREKTVPLVYEVWMIEMEEIEIAITDTKARNWKHGVLIGASVASEKTAAQEGDDIGKIRHDPFAMVCCVSISFSVYKLPPHSCRTI